MQNFASPISFLIAFFTLVEITCRISFESKVMCRWHFLELLSLFQQHYYYSPPSNPMSQESFPDSLSSSSILTPKRNSLQGKMSNNINWSLQSQSIICNLFWSEIAHYPVYMLRLVHQILTRFIGISMSGVKIFPHMKTKRTTFAISNFLPTLKSVNCECILSIMPSWLMKEKTW